MTEIAVVLGTRPELIKMSPIIDLLGPRVRVIHTGQHYDDDLSGNIESELSIPSPDARLGVGGLSRASQIGESLSQLEPELSGSRAVLVQGDTNSALAGALAANALEIPLLHIEAGLRSFDRRMPEEHNRVLIDHLSDVCWAPTSINRNNLLQERIDEARIEVTGNPIVEALQSMKSPLAASLSLPERLGTGEEGYALVTLHRPENVDDASRLSDLLSALNDLPVPSLFPIHPRTRLRIAEFGLEGRVGQVTLVDPLGYSEFLAAIESAAVVVSDSGGIQEEASVLKVPLVVVRRSTERPEVMGTFASLCQSPEAVVEQAREFLDRGSALRERLRRIPSPYGDGKASLRIVESLEAFLRDRVG